MLFPSLTNDVDKFFDRVSEILEDVKKVDLDGAKLIDTHTYEEGYEDYEQKVYRLPDNRIYVETKPLHTNSKERLKFRIDKAVRKEDYVAAARLKKLLDALK